MIQNLYRFTSLAEAAFCEYMFKRNRLAFRISSIGGIIYTLAMTLREYIILSFEQFVSALLIRLLMLAVTFFAVTVTFLPILSTRNHQIIFQAIMVFYIGLVFYIDLAVLSANQLPFDLGMFSFVTFTAFGLFALRALVINALFLIAYLILISTMDLSWLGVPHYFVSLIFATIIGFLFERQSRINFHQENKLKEANRYLKSADESKRKILSVLSHDLNAPLSSLKMLVELSSADNISREMFQDMTKKIGISLDYSSSILKDITRWSKAKLENFIIERERVNVRNIFQELTYQFDATMREKDIQLIYDFKQDPNIRGDKEMLKSIFRNLLSNAIKFSPFHSEVVVSDERVGENLIISIRDQGEGMTPDQIDLLFKPGSGIRKGTSQEVGSGLGLIIVKDFVEAHGGQVSVYSQVGKGSAFRVELPIK
jgi:signal transduction histidine kinase